MQIHRAFFFFFCILKILGRIPFKNIFHLIHHIPNKYSFPSFLIYTPPPPFVFPFFRTPSEIPWNAFWKYCFSKKDQDRNIKMWSYINDQLISVVVVQSLSCVWLSVTPWTAASLVLQYLPEFAQIHVHWVSNARCYLTISSSAPPSPFTFSLSQHQGLFQWVGSSHEVAKVLKLQLQPQSFQWIFRVDFLLYWFVGSPCSPRDSQESSPAPQFKSINC